jgi:hypothetical protein
MNKHFSTKMTTTDDEKTTDVRSTYRLNAYYMQPYMRSHDLAVPYVFIA